MKAKLSIIERVKLLEILPQEGNFLTLRMVQELKRKVGFDAEELVRIEFKQDEREAHWNPDRDSGLEREFLQPEIDLITAALRRLDKAEKLTEHYLPLYTLFVKD